MDLAITNVRKQQKPVLKTNLILGDLIYK